MTQFTANHGSRVARPGHLERRQLQARAAATPARIFVRRATALLVLAAGAWAFVFGQSAIASSTPGSSASFTYVTVEAGDTLWSLAETYATGEDARDWIQDLASLNALASAEIYPGQQLALPQR